MLILAVLAFAFMGAAVYNLIRGDGVEAAGGFGISLLLGAVAAGLKVRDRRRISRWIARASELEGLGKLPITRGELKDLLDWIDRPNPPECTHTLRESAGFLPGRGLPVEPTLEWLRANGACCDCEVILNVDDKFGAEVGSRPR